MASSSRAPPGAWNARKGQRILTEAQRQRKRERDRITKREEKAKFQQRLQQLEETKDSSAKRIKELEAKVKLLSSSCACHNVGADGAVACGGSSHSSPADEARNTCFSDRKVPLGPLPLQSRGNAISLKQQEASIHDATGKPITNHYELPYVHASNSAFSSNYYSVPPQPEYIYTSTSKHHDKSVHVPSNANDIPWRPANSSMATDSEPSTPISSIVKNALPNLLEIPIPHSRNVSVINQFLDPNGLEITNDFNKLAEKGKALKDELERVVLDDATSEDFIIRAVLGGWERAYREHQGPICPLWPILQMADEYMWNNTPHPVRFAYLLQHHRVFLYFLFQKPIPKWLVPSPFIRDRLVLIGDSGKRRTIINKSWITYNRCAQFIFPRSETLLHFNTAKNIYQFTPNFERAWNNINNFTFEQEYFYEFPYLVEELEGRMLEDEMRWPLSVYVEGQEQSAQERVQQGRVSELGEVGTAESVESEYPLKVAATNTTTTSAAITVPSTTLAGWDIHASVPLLPTSFETPFPYSTGSIVFGQF
ncbi:hypothetical protein G7Y89_g7372 [Cudoniella acicularis]|uniref:BZIP domain-containing protein n=1 Tax=Cudoniella acicularis TaxID=354080 RepID=A0A8H4W3W1_9HELO|nr:hypothetical protein G7Y89_g7372 [Cudoniella acicularis]